MSPKVRLNVPFVLGICACGCGKDIPIRAKGKFLQRFFHGHNYCQFKKGHLHIQWKGGRKITAQGYVEIHKREHPNSDRNGYIKEHRWIMEQYLRRYLETNEIVHHINHNKQDNRLENLELMTHSEHARLHMIEENQKRRLK